MGRANMDADDSFWKWLVGVLTAGASTMFGYHKYIASRIDKKADKDTVNRDFNEVRDELQLQRQNVSKLFDQIRNSDQRAQDRHERLMDRMDR